MSFIADTQNVLGDYKSQLDAENEKFSKVKEQFNNERITARVFNESQDAHRKQLDAIRLDHESALRDALQSYIDSLPSRYAKTAESINAEDVALMSSELVPLNAEDVSRLYKKYSDAGNLPMMEVIFNYEERAKTGAEGIVFYSKKKREESARDYLGGCIGALRDVHGLQFGYYESAAAVPPELVGE